MEDREWKLDSERIGNSAIRAHCQTAGEAGRVDPATARIQSWTRALLSAAKKVATPSPSAQSAFADGDFDEGVRNWPFQQSAPGKGTRSVKRRCIFSEDLAHGLGLFWAPAIDGVEAIVFAVKCFVKICVAFNDPDAETVRL
jgi:hypothetical protein